MTQPMLVERVGLGRSVVAQRVAELETAGLVEGAGLGPSSGGRASRQLRLRGDRGRILGVDIAATELVVGLADLSGTLLATRQQAIDVADGPEPVLSLAEKLADELIGAAAAPIWAIGVGVPGPVEFRSGLPVVPPIMPGWDRYPIRDRFSARYGAPASELLRRPRDVALAQQHVQRDEQVQVEVDQQAIDGHAPTIGMGDESQ
ncbi:ROK family protein [Actinomadura sp. OS1-43]|uniref:ROK family protein n=1 Tax=Actinomadura sp. OS1-43 TaxID=604315 RepID=UPI00255B13DD|nr:ROK family protein [Actinomadura sp. OS1-43]MDL4814181.1 ROK family protein [Actinomadura sp. OS1-43]